MPMKVGRKKPEGAAVVAEYQVVFALLRAGEIVEVLDSNTRIVEIYDTDTPEDKQKARDKLGQSVASMISRNRFVIEREKGETPSAE